MPACRLLGRGLSDGWRGVGVREGEGEFNEHLQLGLELDIVSSREGRGEDCTRGGRREGGRRGRKGGEGGRGGKEDRKAGDGGMRGREERKGGDGGRREREERERGVGCTGG